MAAMTPEQLQLLQQVALAKARKLSGHGKAPPAQPGISLTPADMSQADIQQKAMGMGLVDPLAPVQPQGGVDQAPANVLQQVPAGQGAPPPAPAAAAAPAPAVAPAVGGQLGPGV